VACLVAAVNWGAFADRDARERFRARQPQVALQKAVYSRAPQQQGEQQQLQAAPLALRGERAPAASKEQWASRGRALLLMLEPAP
jgi:hypothetical protein